MPENDDFDAFIVDKNIKMKKVPLQVFLSVYLLAQKYEALVVKTDKLVEGQ